MKSFVNHGQISNSQHLQEAPLDWVVVVADLVGSTEAVFDGKYLEVNLIGSACIAAIRNHYSSREIIHTFGGDGATFLLPPDKLEHVLTLLEDVQFIASEQLGFDLRVGHITVEQVAQLGGTISYGILDWNDHESFTYIRGNGIGIADREIKRSYNVYEDRRDVVAKQRKATISGVSCRLLPFKTNKDEILSLIIEPLCEGEDEDQLLEEVFQCIGEEGDLSKVSPLTLKNHKRGISLSVIKREAYLFKEGKGRLSYIKASWSSLLGSILTYFMFVLKLDNTGLGETDKYTQALLRQSDWIKMDGALRLVIDVSSDEKRALLGTLEALEKAGRIRYGHNSSNSAVMVCHYRSGIDDRHVHFIDGDKGGLTRAALALKEKK